MNIDELSSQLIFDASPLDLSLSESESHQLIKYLLLVIEKNKVLNLTRIIDPVDGIRRHLIDSLLFNKFINNNGKLIDIGTGAGFPGIPIALTNRLEKVILLDSVAKKIRAVNEFLPQLEFNDSVSAISERVETYSKAHKSEFQFVCARAVASLNTLIEYATPLLCKNGILIASKGNLSDKEFADADIAANLCGLICVSRETFELPEASGHREFVIYQKVNKSKIKLPRRIGLAKHQPLSNKQ